MTATTVSHILDEPWRWADNSTWPRPVFDVAAFQKKIDEIVGVTLKGQSIVRLRWMRDPDCYEKFYTKWDLATPVAFDLRARYKFATVDLPNGDFVDIPPPRWVLEQRYEPEQIAAEWEKARWETVDGMPRPKRDACPAEGYYSHLWTIAAHSPDCCVEGVSKDGTVCWGMYRQPSEKDLTTLRAMMWRKRKDGLRTDPFEKPSAAVEDKVIRRQHNFDEEAQGKKNRLQREIIDDAVRQALHKFTDDPSVLKHGKYHILDSSKRKT